MVDLLHEFELGVWKMLFIHLLRILTAEDKSLINKLDQRYALLFDVTHQLTSLLQDTGKHLRLAPQLSENFRLTLRT